jgi:hypothetical protein
MDKGPQLYCRGAHTFIHVARPEHPDLPCGTRKRVRQVRVLDLRPPYSVGDGLVGVQEREQSLVARDKPVHELDCTCRTRAGPAESTAEQAPREGGAAACGRRPRSDPTARIGAAIQPQIERSEEEVGGRLSLRAASVRWRRLDVLGHAKRQEQRIETADEIAQIQIKSLTWKQVRRASLPSYDASDLGL